MQNVQEKARDIGKSVENNREITGTQTGTEQEIPARTWLSITASEDDVVIASEPSFQVGTTP